MLPAGEEALHGIINRLRQELQVVTQQLSAARSENAELLDQVSRLHSRKGRYSAHEDHDSGSSGSTSRSSCSSSSGSESSGTGSPSAARSRSSGRRSIGNKDLASRISYRRVDESVQEPSSASSTAHWRASQQFPIAYVPPLDFLPEVFVEEYLDVIRIIDKYAQLFHRCHVGGGVALRDPRLFNDADADRSTAELQEQKIIQMEGLLVAEQANNANLQHKLEILQKRFNQLQHYGVASALDTATLERDDSSVAVKGRRLPPKRGDVDAAADSSADVSSGDDAAAAARRATRRSRSKHAPVPAAAALQGEKATSKSILSPFPLLEPWHRIVES